MDENRIGPLLAQAKDGLLAAVGGAVVHDPEDTACGLVGLLAHYLADQPIVGGDPRFGFAAPKDLSAMDIPSSQVGPCSLAKVLMLDAGRAMGSRRQGGMFPTPGLDAGLFVGRQDVVIDTERHPLPSALIEIEDGSRAGSKVGISREDPTPMAPRTESIPAEPPPQRGPADLGYQTLAEHVLAEIRHGESRQRQTEAVREFAGESLNLDDETGGKSGSCARPEVAPRGQVVGANRSACATC
jgi:hypothetical protein